MFKEKKLKLASGKLLGDFVDIIYKKISKSTESMCGWTSNEGSMKTFHAWNLSPLRGGEAENPNMSKKVTKDFDFKNSLFIEQ